MTLGELAKKSDGETGWNNMPAKSLSVSGKRKTAVARVIYTRRQKYE
jgi:hypothetical protein